MAAEALAILPPLARFFLALLLVILVTVSTVLFTYWIMKGSGGE
ncbi:hypothetical protein [Rubrobacter xylanophilus]|nr:hypothetical protein [Rubrobacter xylanophilus]